MAYLLRSLAVIGVIALNSPVHDGKSGADDAGQPVRSVAAPAAAPLDVRSAINGMTAAREAAQILAGLDPETRSRMPDAAAAAGCNRKAPPDALMLDEWSRRAEDAELASAANFTHGAAGSGQDMSASLDEIVSNFELLDEWDDRYRYLIELGKGLEPLPEDAHNDVNKVRGCASQVWLEARREGGPGAQTRLHFRGDSDAHIVRGLVALALAIYSGRTASEILATDAFSIYRAARPRRPSDAAALERRALHDRAHQDSTPARPPAEPSCAGAAGHDARARILAAPDRYRGWPAAPAASRCRNARPAPRAPAAARPWRSAPASRVRARHGRAPSGSRRHRWRGLKAPGRACRRPA